MATQSALDTRAHCNLTTYQKRRDMRIMKCTIYRLYHYKCCHTTQKTLTHLHRQPMQRRMRSDFQQNWMHNKAQGKTIVCGHKCTNTGLWMIPLDNTHARLTSPTITPTKIPTSTIANITHMQDTTSPGCTSNSYTNLLGLHPQPRSCMHLQTTKNCKPYQGSTRQ